MTTNTTPREWVDLLTEHADQLPHPDRRVPGLERLAPLRVIAAILGVSTTAGVRSRAQSKPGFPAPVLPHRLDLWAVLAWSHGQPPPPPVDVSDLLDYEGQAEIIGVSPAGAAGYASRKHLGYPAPLIDHFRHRDDIEAWHQRRPRTRGRPPAATVHAYGVVWDVGTRVTYCGKGEEGRAAAARAVAERPGGQVLRRVEVVSASRPAPYRGAKWEPVTVDADLDR